MTKKTLWMVFTALVLAGVGVYWWLSGQTYQIRISQIQIEQKLAEKLPLTRNFLLFYLTLEHPRVQLREDSSRVQLGLDVVIAPNAGAIIRPLRATADVTAGLRYDPAQGAFFLTDPVVQKLGVEGVDENRTNAINTALSKALSAYLAERPVYTLSGFDHKQRMARMVLKAVKVERGELVVELGV